MSGTVLGRDGGKRLPSLILNLREKHPVFHY